MVTEALARIVVRMVENCILSDGYFDIGVVFWSAWMSWKVME
jgi:hypothetical protein